MNFILKPVFVRWTTLLAILPLQIFFSAWLTGFLDGAIIAVFKPEFSKLHFFLIFGSFIFLLIPIIFFNLKKYNYKNTDYRFFEDRLEFEEGFLTINKKVINLHDVKEVSLKKAYCRGLKG